MKRRDLLRLAGATALGTAAGKVLPARTQKDAASAAPITSATETSRPDITLHIAPVAVDLTANHAISTTGYNGTSPGPLLRMREGVPITVEAINETDVPEYVHWHGLHIPSDVDGVEEEETPPVPPHGKRRYRFIPRPAGTRWYHSHVMAGANLHRGTYTGQFGFIMVESGNNPGSYDQELFLALHDWEPFFTTQQMDTDEQDQIGPQPERPAVLDTRPNGWEVSSQIFSINDKVLGAGDPIRVRPGQRLLLHILNASALENRKIALPGHRFHVVALDGNPVPKPQSVDVLLLGPGERIDAYVDMNRPGVWILGATQDGIRNSGLGVVVEYANQHQQPQWLPPPMPFWDYTIFGEHAPHPEPDHTIDMAFEKVPRGAGMFNLWLVNGKPYPHGNEFVLQEGKRYRIIYRNRTDDAHPLHMHRHSFELVDVNGKKTSGIIKDTVIVPYYGRATVDLVADQPGLTLFHCHIQQHMDYGFKALFRYA